MSSRLLLKLIKKYIFTYSVFYNIFLNNVNTIKITCDRCDISYLFYFFGCLCLCNNNINNKIICSCTSTNILYWCVCELPRPLLFILRWPIPGYPDTSRDTRWIPDTGIPDIGDVHDTDLLPLPTVLIRNYFSKNGT